MSFGLRDEMMNLKNKLESLEEELTNQMLELEVKAEEWHKRDEEMDELSKKNRDKVVTLNVGGKTFQTRLETLLSMKDTLFSKIFSSGKLDITKTIFIDRSYYNFQSIISYLRNKKLTTVPTKNKEIEELLEEAQFYEIQELVELLEEMLREIKFVGFEFAAPYSTAGTNKIEDINNFEDRTLMKGICSTSWIIFELNREVFKTIFYINFLLG